MILKILAFLAKGIALTFAFALVLSFVGFGAVTVAYVTLALSDALAFLPR